ncbi:MAG: MFS transporter [Gammaproteobacteria bacterium]|nr:MFS transporter [Gammaproteobacteria bacterium]
MNVVVFHALRDYARFVLRHRRLLAFGLLAAALSGFGQTFYIGLFNTALRADFGLSHSELGLVYGGATLASATLLLGVGRLYDRLDLRLFLSGAVAIVAAGCLLLAAAGGMMALMAALFLLRLGGQGLMGHIAMTTMAQRFHHGRGKAVSLASMGFPLSEAVFPAVAVAALALVEWRGLWQISAAVVAGLFLPLLLLLLRGQPGGETPAAPAAKNHPDWRVGQVVRDWRFVLILPTALAPPFVVTVALFHQVPMALLKGWSTELVASGMALFALGHVSGLLGAGPLVDRWSATRVFVPAQLPLAGAMAVLALVEAPWGALLWPALLGLGLGLASTALTPLLAERYGVMHLGAIRALVQALMILSTAIGPPLLGWLLDLGLHTTTLAGGIALTILAAALAARLTLAGTPLRN